MTVNERRSVGVLALDELKKLRKALQVHHARNPGQRVAVQQAEDGSVNVWRLK